MIDPGAREAQAAGLLDDWPWKHGGVLIGGYAVAAYGAPRYSDDLDIVVPVSGLEAIMGWLEEEKMFRKLKVPPDLVQNYAGKVGRWQSGDIVVDLLPGAVRDREAKVDIPEHWITKSPIVERLVLLETSTRTRVPVVRREAFWALKLQAGRLRDLGDLMSIGADQTDLSQVRDLFEGLMCESLAAKLAKVLDALQNEKFRADMLSQRLLGSPKLPRNVRAWENLRRNAAACVPGVR